jgi:hypothetical protein
MSLLAGRSRAMSTLGKSFRPVRRTLLPAILAILLSAHAATDFRVEQLQGAWWSDLQNPTADFAIHGNEVWLDFDSQYHPCRVEGDILIFDLGGGEFVRSRIVSLQGDRLVLQTPEDAEERILTRVTEAP